MPILVKDGLCQMAHEARTDWAMLLDASFPPLTGPERSGGGDDGATDRELDARCLGLADLPKLFGVSMVERG